MALTIDTVTLVSGNNLHGDVVTGSYERTDVKTQFHATVGESWIPGESGGRPLQCRVVLQQYDSREDLQAVVEFYESVENTNGELKITSGALATGNRPFKNVTFLGFVISPEGIRKNLVDGKWFAVGQLFFRQHKRS